MVNFSILLKSLAYRIFGISITTILTLILTKDWQIALSVGLADNLIKIITYYVFELFWSYKKVEKKAKVLWLTGLSGAGKTTIAQELITKLNLKGYPTVLLDGDEIRKIFPKTGFSKEERLNHINRVAQMACVLESQGITSIVSLISPYRESRDEARKLCQNFLEVYISTPLTICEDRDVKGLYAKVRKGEIKNFTGIDDPYEPPLNPELNIDTTNLSLEESVNIILGEFP